MFVLRYSWVVLVVFWIVSIWRTCKWDQTFWHWAGRYPPEFPDSLEVWLYLEQVQDPVSQMKQISLRIEPCLLWVSLWCHVVFLYCIFNLWICEHLADGTWSQKAQALSYRYLPKGHFFQKLWDLSVFIMAYCISVFLFWGFDFKSNFVLVTFQ